ncbi:MAG TPA: SDR family NAD(P)-dependent oxidoreductase [Candidatus Acidoferrales bacterium]|nr:SDR family NAD(P)-dependent oxidoreductase [Candidatus Acidoferrales bacterium]
MITGGAGGIGTAIAQQLIDLGHRVVSLDRVASRVASGSAIVDVADESAVTSAVLAAAEAHDGIDALVCAAGTVTESPVETMSLADWRLVVDASLTGTFLATRAVLPYMKRKRRGKIVAISSGFGSKGYRNGSHYAAAKAGMEAFIKSVALEVAGDGITANAIAPGPVQTPFLDLVDDPGRYPLLAQQIPMKRLGTPADVAGAAVFLLGEKSDYITGQVVHVNGGFYMP